MPAANAAVAYLIEQNLTSEKPASALEFYTAAANAGDAEAAANLGAIYLRGEGVPADDAKAVSWFRKAAEAGNAAGATKLGMMYLVGRGIARDDRAAAQWIRKAAGQKFPPALLLLSKLYLEGRGVEKSPMQALTYRSQIPAEDRPTEDGLKVMLTVPVEVFRLQMQHGSITAALMSKSDIAGLYPNLNAAPR
jgi:TPR repeat protein